VSGASTLVMSEIWPTSSLAATRGEMFLPEAVAAKTEVAVAAGQREHLRGDVLGEAVREDLGVGVQHLGDAVDRRRGARGTRRAGAGDQDSGPRRRAAWRR
jgi:hypothetical protein